MTERRLETLPVRFVRGAGMISLAVGIMVLIGWATDSAVIKSLHPDWTPMKANSALCFALLGTALVVFSVPGGGSNRERAGFGLAGLAAAIGTVTLVEYIAGWNAGIDELLFREPNVEEGWYAGRMSPLAALGFSLLGTGLLLRGRSWRGATVLFQLTMFIALLTGLMGCFDYMLSAAHSVMHIALHTSITLALLAGGALFSQVDRGFMRLLMRRGHGGKVMRRLLPAALLLPLLLAWLRWQGEQLGHYDELMGVSLHTLASICTLVPLILWTAASLNRTEQERERVEEELRDQEDFLRNILEILPVGVWLMDAEGNIVRHNGEGRRIWGGAREVGIDEYGEYKGWWSDTGKRVEPHEWAAARALRGESPHDELIDIEAFDGARRTILNSGVPLTRPDGTIFGAVVTNHDVTERRQIELDMEQSAGELRRSNAELEQFAYVASHDLQEPLRAVNGCVQIFQRRYGDKDDPQATELIQHIVDGVSRMQSLINDLLALSRVGRRGKKFEPVDCAEIMGVVHLNLRVAIEGAHAVIMCDRLPTVNGDASQLTQLFQNLVGNALKFHRPGALPTVNVSAQRNGAGWEFSVRDNGIGIDPQYAERIFGVFHRLHTREEYSGTGIGLAICKKIVERHGGRIWIEPAPEHGTVFRFTIPDEKPEPSHSDQ